MQRIASIILSIYIAIVIYTNAFFIKALTIGKGSDELFWNHLAIFLIILVPVFFLINKLVSFTYVRGVIRHARAGFLSIVLLGLVVALLYHVIPLAPIYDLPPVVDKFFASDLAFTIWLLVPLLALFV